MKFSWLYVFVFIHFYMPIWNCSVVIFRCLRKLVHPQVHPRKLVYLQSKEGAQLPIVRLQIISSGGLVLKSLRGEQPGQGSLQQSSRHSAWTLAQCFAIAISRHQMILVIIGSIWCWKMKISGKRIFLLLFHITDVCRFKNCWIVK